MRKWILVTALFSLPGAAAAQDLNQRCATVANQSDQRFCNLLVEALDIAQPRIGLALVGGNPVPGASSTLGMRLGTVPRISLAGRLSAATLELPPIQRQGSTDDITAAVPSVNID